MSNIATARIQREFKEVIKSEEAIRNNIKVELIDDSFTRLQGEIVGPPDTPYEGGTYIVHIQIPETYPFNPPKVKFLTKIWHPNISSVTGAICLDILKDEWAAAMTLRTVLLSIQALLGSPEPDDPQDAVVARQYKDNYKAFYKTAKHWAHVHAGGKKIEDDCSVKLQQLMDMGFDMDRSRTALSTYSWNVERAIEALFNTVGGTVAAVATCPLEVIKTRLQSSNPVFQPLGVHPTDIGHRGGVGVLNSIGSCSIQLEVTRPSGIIGIMRHMIQTEGVTSLYKGLGPNLVGVAPARAIYFAVYAKAKKNISRSGFVNADNPLVHVGAGASAGFITHTCTAPVWFVKTRLQLDSSLSSKKLSAWKLSKRVYKTQGIRGFYRGLSASYFGISETIIHFVIYEQIKKILRTAHAPKSSQDVHGGQRNLFTDFMIAAGISKSIASIIAYPHEVIRTRLRQEYDGSDRKYKTFIQSLRLIFQEEGRRGLYGGLATQLVRQVPNSAIMFMTYESIVTFLCGEDEEE